jgi:hypothetical protein
MLACTFSRSHVNPYVFNTRVCGRAVTSFASHFYFLVLELVLSKNSEVCLCLCVCLCVCVCVCVSVCASVCERVRALPHGKATRIQRRNIVSHVQRRVLPNIIDCKRLDSCHFSRPTNVGERVEVRTPVTAPHVDA